MTGVAPPAAPSWKDPRSLIHAGPPFEAAKDPYRIPGAFPPSLPPRYRDRGGHVAPKAQIRSHFQGFCVTEPIFPLGHGVMV